MVVKPDGGRLLMYLASDRDPMRKVGELGAALVQLAGDVLGGDLLTDGRCLYAAGQPAVPLSVIVSYRRLQLYQSETVVNLMYWCRLTV